MSSPNWKSNSFFRNGDIQTHEPVKGKVTGQIPSWLEGTLIRNGSGIFKVGNDEYQHLFDGLSVLHRFHIKDGEAVYQSRALESDTYKENMEAQRIVVSEFGTKVFKDPCHTLFNRFKATFANLIGSGEGATTDNCSVNVAYYSDQLYAMTETKFIRRIDPENLNTIGPKTNISEYIAVNGATAHPHILSDGTVLNMGTNYRHKKGTHYCIIKVPTCFDTGDESSYKHAEIVAEIPARWKMYPAYYHSFGMTQDKIIFIESPLTFSIPKLVASDLSKSSSRSCMTTYSNEMTKFYVVSLTDGKIHPVVYETDGLFTFHHINAYEENGHLVVDVAGYNSGEIVQELTTDMMDSPGKWIKEATARRFVLPLNITDGEKPGNNLVEMQNTTARAMLSDKSKPGNIIVNVTPHHLSTKWLELPRINYKYNGEHYNYFYGLTGENPGQKGIDEPNIISKVNISTGEETNVVLKDSMASEPVFIANPTVENPSEDDGVLLSAILDKNDPTNVTLLILDAKTMKEVASVLFKAKGVVTATFHGMWANQKDKIHTY